MCSRTFLQQRKCDEEPGSSLSFLPLVLSLSEFLFLSTKDKPFLSPSFFFVVKKHLHLHLSVRRRKYLYVSSSFVSLSVKNFFFSLSLYHHSPVSLSLSLKQQQTHRNRVRAHTHLFLFLFSALKDPFCLDFAFSFPSSQIVIMVLMHMGEMLI